MKRTNGSETQAASQQIDKRIADLNDWRGDTLSRMRKLIKEADPAVAEEWKWAKATSPGVPVWSHDGIICTGAGRLDSHRSRPDSTNSGHPSSATEA